jgi:RNA polymerase sigma-70 factor, ECF subfamily
MSVESPDWIDLVDEARVGDALAQEVLLGRFEPLVRATASRLVDPDDVDDVAQASFTVALERLPALRTSAAFPSWLRLIVRKQASLRRRRPPTIPLTSHDQPAPAGCEPDSVVQAQDIGDAVRLALGELRDDDRHLLERRYFADWSNAELARLLDISDSALRKRLHDARHRLRPLLQHITEETAVTDYARFLNQIHDASLDVPAVPPLRRPDDTPTTTGLKVIDTIAPVRRGGTVELVGPAGTGQAVVAVELLYRLGRTTSDVVCIAVGAAGVALGFQRDLGHLITEPGVPGPAAVVLTKTASEAAHAVATAARLAAGLAHAGSDTVLIVDEPTVQAVASTTLVEAAGLADTGSVSVVAVRALDKTAPLPAQLGFDTTLVFSVEQFALGIFPSIDPIRSSSRFAISDVGERARQHLRHAATLREWFNQPLFIAEDYTGTAGVWIEPATAELELAQQLP